jgi:hypothetical protein
MTEPILNQRQLVLFRKAWYGPEGRALIKIAEDDFLQTILLSLVVARVRRGHDPSEPVHLICGGYVNNLDEFKTLPSLATFLEVCGRDFKDHRRVNLVPEGLSNPRKIWEHSVQVNKYWNSFCRQDKGLKWPKMTLDELLDDMAMVCFSTDTKVMCAFKEIFTDLKNHFCTACSKEHETPETLSLCKCCRINRFCSQDCIKHYWKVMATTRDKWRCKTKWTRKGVREEMELFKRTTRATMLQDEKLTPYFENKIQWTELPDLEKDLLNQLNLRGGRMHIWVIYDQVMKNTFQEGEEEEE